MSDKELAAASQVLALLINYGIPAATALVRAIKAVWGHELTEAEITERLDWLTADAGIRAALAKADSGGSPEA